MERYKKVLQLLELDPSHPSLKLHALRGRLKDKYAASITFTQRIVLTFSKEADELVLLYVGGHDEAYR